MDAQRAWGRVKYFTTLDIFLVVHSLQLAITDLKKNNWMNITFYIEMSFIKMPIRDWGGGIDMGIQINNMCIIHLVKGKIYFSAENSEIPILTLYLESIGLAKC